MKLAMLLCWGFPEFTPVYNWDSDYNWLASNNNVIMYCRRRNVSLGIYSANVMGLAKS